MKSKNELRQTFAFLTRNPGLMSIQVILDFIFIVVFSYTYLKFQMRIISIITTVVDEYYKNLDFNSTDIYAQAVPSALLLKLKPAIFLIILSLVVIFMIWVVVEGLSFALIKRKIKKINPYRYFINFAVKSFAIFIALIFVFFLYMKVYLYFKMNVVLFNLNIVTFIFCFCCFLSFI